MHLSRMVLGFVAVMAVDVAVQTAAHAQERGTEAQRMACTPDVFRLCGSEIPDRDRIVSCLRQNVAQLSRPCRAVFAPDEAPRDYPLRSPPQQQRRFDQPDNDDDD